MLYHCYLVIYSLVYSVLFGFFLLTWFNSRAMPNVYSASTVHRDSTSICSTICKMWNSSKITENHRRVP